MSEQQLPVVLMILDGWGISEQTEGNAIAQSNTKNMDKLLASCGHSKLYSSGEYVGLPEERCIRDRNQKDITQSEAIL